MPFPLQALVFDLDGTLIDSAPDMTRVLNRDLTEFGRPALTEAQVRTMVGDNANDVKAARSAGVPVIAMSYGDLRMPVEELGADLTLDRFADLPDRLLRLAAAD